MSEPTQSLELRLVRSVLRMLLGEGLVLFLAYGSLRYWQAWMLLGVQLATLCVTSVYLVFRDRELLRRRLLVEERGETQPVQKLFVVVFVLLGVLLLAVCALDRRFGWSQVKPAWSVAATLLFVAGSSLIDATFRANTFASSVIEVEPEQRVIATGPYRWVRHPMYSGMLIGNAATPIVLGSYWGELVVVLLGALLAFRAVHEEKQLLRELPGYAEYLGHTRSRIAPRIW